MPPPPQSAGEQYQVEKRGREYHGCGEEYIVEERERANNIIFPFVIEAVGKNIKGTDIFGTKIIITKNGAGDKYQVLRNFLHQSTDYISESSGKMQLLSGMLMPKLRRRQPKPRLMLPTKLSARKSDKTVRNTRKNLYIVMVLVKYRSIVYFCVCVIFDHK